MGSKSLFWQDVLVAGLSLLLFAGSQPRAVAEPPADLRVMSFNIRYGTADDGENHWDHRKDFLVKTVRTFAPDLLGTQETLAFQRDFLASQLSEYGQLGVGRDDGREQGEMMALFYKRDRFEKLAGGHFWLSETPDTIGSKSWDSSLPRMVTWVKLRDLADESAPPLVFFNTHFDHQGKTARLESARLVRRRVVELADGCSVVVTGDFNTGEGSPPYQALFGPDGDRPAPILDTYRTVHPKRADNEGTFNGFRLDAVRGPRIDWIGVSPGWEVRSAAIDHTSRNGRTPSDHFSVTAVVRRKSEAAANGRQSSWAEIRVIDEATGRGVPLAELETVNNLRFVTDNAGRVAFQEPGLMGQEIFFSVHSHGYEAKKDGFGFAGVRITPQAGKRAEIRISRWNVAERLCRLTGEGPYRDTLLLGYESPLPAGAHPGKVAGQDSIQAAIYRGQVFCFWGDTQQMKYPLGLFRMAGATTALTRPGDPGFDPAEGIVYDYFTDAATGFARAMLPLSERPEGVVWVSAIFVVPDENGKERLVGHYSRRPGLADEFEQGICVFNDERAVFESVKQLPLAEKWRRPSGHPIVWEDAGSRWLLFGSPNPNVRVPATLRDVLDPAKYEALTCVKGAGATGEPQLGPDGQPAWRWQTELLPVDSKTEAHWISEGKLNPEDARFCPADAAASSERVVLHSGSVRWNEYRRRWVLLAGQIHGKPSLLGEVWYAESESPTGPFPSAVKVVTHDRQTFYNVCQHAFLDRDGGRTIHFEGTYTNDFSGNPDKTPRYNYNQVLYRLNLDAPALRPAQAR